MRKNLHTPRTIVFGDGAARLGTGQKVLGEGGGVGGGP